MGEFDGGGGRPAWVPVVAERARTPGVVAQAFPCLGAHNRYTGCIGGRRCRATGITVCRLGRWPDERERQVRARYDGAG